MVYELNGRKNICIIGNVITLQIILRNEIPANNNKAWIVFVLKEIKKRLHFKNSWSLVQH